MAKEAVNATVDSQLKEKVREKADRLYGGNVSRYIEDLIKRDLEKSKGGAPFTEAQIAFLKAMIQDSQPRK